MPERMKDTLAKLQWAERKTKEFADSVLAFSEREPFRLSSAPAPNGRGLLFRFEVLEETPEDLVLEAGAIMHAQRSALDTLVYELAQDAGHRQPKGTAFPIRERKSDMEEAARRCLRLLDEPDRSLILSTKPYAEGNPTIYILHKLNIGDKHHKLPVMGAWPSGPTSIKGNGFVDLFTQFAGPFSNGDPVAQFDASEGMSFELNFSVGLSDSNGENLVNAIGFLKACNSEIRRISELFR